MTSTHTTRVWKALALLATILVLLLLLIPQPAHHHGVAVLFLLSPILLFGLLDTLAPQRLAVPTNAVLDRHPNRPSLFQRPPPVLV
jgi:hypothetical protein